MGRIYRNPGRTVWMMKYYKDGLPVRETTGTDDERKARKVLAALETDRDRGLPVPAAIGKVRFEAAAERLVLDYRKNGFRSLDDAERRIRVHLTPVFRGWKMTDITTAVVETYQDTRLAEGAAPGTINRELALLKRMFALAKRGGLLLYQPHIPLLKEHNVRAGFFEQEAFAQVRRRLPVALQGVVTFAYVTGWRIDSEVLPLEWRQVDLVAGEVVLDPRTTKNDEARVFPLTADLRAVLETQAAARDAALKANHLCPWVFFRMVAKGRRGPKAPKRIRRFNKAWAAACTAASCPGRIPHDFRRTAIRNMVRRGIPERVAMQLSGHKTRAVFERYNIVSPGDLREAAGKLQDLVPAATGTPTGTPAAEPGSAAATASRKSKVFGGAARI